MKRKRHHVNGRRLILGIMILILIVATGAIWVPANALDEGYDPALAWEGEARTVYRLSHCGDRLTQACDDLKGSQSHQESWDPALAWEGQACLE